MHWFWRATIAVVVSFLAFTAINAVLAWTLSPSAYGSLPLHLGLGMAGYATPLLIFGLLSRWYAPVRFLPGHCQKCGYNLTGNVSGVCPECGERV
jgi:hypothetical protein